MTVDIQLADARFLLPELPTRFAGLELDARHQAAWAAVAEQVDPDDARLSSGGVLVGGASAVDRIASSGAAQVLVYGDCARPLRRAGYVTSRWVMVGEDLLEGYLPLDNRIIGRRAVKKWRRPTGAPRRVAARIAIEARWAPSGRQVVTVGSAGGPIAAVGAAIELGLVPPGSRGALDSPGTAARSRLAAPVFAPGDERPRWVVKFGRIAEAELAFEHDQRAFELLAQHEVVAEHAPKLLGRFTLGGLPAAVETFARGEGFNRLLTRLPDREIRATIDRIAAWLTACTTETLHPLGPSELWLDGALVDRVGSVRSAASSLEPRQAVVGHNDLGPWNMKVDGDTFCAIDWEDASASSPPMWDLTYFLTETCTVAGGAVSIEERVQAAIAIFRGDHPWSPVVLGHLRTAADRLSLTSEQAGGLVLGSWLHHSVPLGRERQVPAEFVADAWLDDPLLGPDWALP